MPRLHYFFYKIYDDADDEDGDYSFMLCFSGNDVVLLRLAESDNQIINRALGQFNTVVTLACAFIYFCEREVTFTFAMVSSRSL